MTHNLSKYKKTNPKTRYIIPDTKNRILLPEYQIRKPTITYYYQTQYPKTLYQNLISNNQKSIPESQTQQPKFNITFRTSNKSKEAMLSNNCGNTSNPVEGLEKYPGSCPKSECTNNQCRDSLPACSKSFSSPYFAENNNNSSSTLDVTLDIHQPIYRNMLLSPDITPFVRKLRICM